MDALKQIFENMNIKIKNRKLEKEFFECCEKKKLTERDIKTLSKAIAFYGDKFAEVFALGEEERMGFEENEVTFDDFYCYTYYIDFWFKLPNSAVIKKTIEIEISTSEMRKEEYEKYMKVAEAISKEVEVRKMREEFLRIAG